MSLITINKELNDTAIVFLNVSQGIISTETKGDLTIIKTGDTVTGLNIRNCSKHLKTVNGTHTLNKEQVNSIQKLGYKIDNYESKFSIGEILERENHPNSEKLFLLKIKTDKELQIVTNSLNSLVGKKVVVANVGATLPSGIAILDSKVMGVESKGMLCSSKTLGLNKSSRVLLIDGNPGNKYIL